MEGDINHFSIYIEMADFMIFLMFLISNFHLKDHFVLPHFRYMIAMI